MDAASRRRTHYAWLACGARAVSGFALPVTSVQLLPILEQIVAADQACRSTRQRPNPYLIA